MSRYRFIHAADLHLDTPFQGIGRVAPAVADALRDASLEAWDGLVRLAIEREAAFVLIAGDVYDGAERGVRAQLRFRRGLEQLAERGIQVLVVHGNHDPLDGWSAIRHWPPGVTVFGSTDVQSVAVERDGVRLATVHGISYPQRDVTENLALRFKRGPEPGLHIGLLHCNVGSSEEHALYCPCTIEHLKSAGMDYWALGHLHRLQLLSDADPLVVYPGCTQGRSAKASEQGAKGALVLEADEIGIQAIDFAPLDRVRFVRLEIDIGGLHDLADLQRTMMRRAEELRQANDGRGLLIRATLTGRGAAHRDLLRAGAADDLLKELRRETDGQVPFVWWELIQDDTRLLQDLVAVRSRGDFSSELLRLGDRLKADPDKREQCLFQEFEALRRCGVQRWIAAPDEREGLGLVEAAERLAVDLLEEDQLS